MTLQDEHGTINTDWENESDEDYRRACRARIRLALPGFTFADEVAA